MMYISLNIKKESPHHHPIPLSSPVHIISMLCLVMVLLQHLILLVVDFSTTRPLHRHPHRQWWAASVQHRLELMHKLQCACGACHAQPLCLQIRSSLLDARGEDVLSSSSPACPSKMRSTREERFSVGTRLPSIILEWASSPLLGDGMCSKVPPIADE